MMVLVMPLPVSSTSSPRQSRAESTPDTDWLVNHLDRLADQGEANNTAVYQADHASGNCYKFGKVTFVMS